MNIFAFRYADLGVKHIGGSGTNSLNTSQASLQVSSVFHKTKQKK